MEYPGEHPENELLSPGIEYALGVSRELEALSRRYDEVVTRVDEVAAELERAHANLPAEDLPAIELLQSQVDIFQSRLHGIEITPPTGQ